MVDNSTDVWPECERGASDQCEGEVDPRRWRLGLRWCKACADPPKEYCSVQMHKSNAVLVTSKEQLKYVGVKTPRGE